MSFKYFQHDVWEESSAEVFVSRAPEIWDKYCLEEEIKGAKELKSRCEQVIDSCSAELKRREEDKKVIAKPGRKYKSPVGKFLCAYRINDFPFLSMYDLARGSNVGSVRVKEDTDIRDQYCGPWTYADAED